MEHLSAGQPFWQDVTVMLAATAFVTAAFRKLGWNPILGLIAAGAAIGPQGFGLIDARQGVGLLGDIGVMFLLFAVGMELSPDRIRAMARAIFGAGGAHFALCALVLACFSQALGADWNAAVAIGVALAMSSTAFVIQLLAERGRLNQRSGRISFAVLLYQDLMVAPILAFIPQLAGQFAVQGEGAAMQMLPAVICMFILFMVVRMLLETVLGVIHETARADAFPAAILFTALAMGWAAKALGLSPTLGAFLAGFAISGASWRHEVKAAIGPFETTLLGFFFIGIGLGVPLDAPLPELGFMAVAALGIVGVKLICGAAACLVNGIPLRDAMRAAFALAQAGEFSIVVLATAAANMLLPSDLAVFWTSAAVLSMMMTPFLIWCGEKLAPEPADPEADASEAGAATGTRPDAPAEPEAAQRPGKEV